jgi:hypothetical protein
MDFICTFFEKIIICFYILKTLNPSSSIQPECRGILHFLTSFFIYNQDNDSIKKKYSILLVDNYPWVR